MTFAVPTDLATGDVFPEAWADQVRDNFTAMSTWSTYTPTWTQSATITKTITRAKYVRIGDYVTGTVDLAATSAGTASNAILVGLPFAHNHPIDSIIGTFWYVDSGTANYAGILVAASAAGGTTGKLVQDQGVDYIGTSTVAVTVASGDKVHYAFMYEAQ